MSDLYLRTTVRPEVEKKAFKQVCKVCTGAAALIACSEFLLPLLQFEALGIWAWLLGGSCAGLGVMPYQRLKQHKVRPEILQINHNKISLVADSKSRFSLPWNEVDSFNYLDNGTNYGLAFTLKPHTIQEIAKDASKAHVPVELVQKSRKEHGVDLFLPFFSQGSYQMLESWYDQNVRDKVLDEV